MSDRAKFTPPKPAARPEKTSLRNYLRLFRKDILSAQPAKLYRAWMAEFKTPFFRSFLVNQPDLVKTVLNTRPMEFPKSNRIAEGLRPLLGNSVFLTNGETWLRQRRIIDPAFEGGRIKDAFPAMLAAGHDMVARLGEMDGGFDVEPHTSHAAADVIFRSLFSIPITDETARAVFHEFQAHQKAQPILNLAAFIPLPKWVPRFHSRETKRTARVIRGLITRLTRERMAQIAAGTAPDDLATKIMTTADPQTGARFDMDEMVDQVAIFFLAGHETSASALAWALWLMAANPDVADRVAAEGAALGDAPTFSDLSKLRYTKDVFRETLRLYPPVPMMVREAACPEHFRDRDVPKGSQIVLSPWHLQRHERFWEDADVFDPDRFKTDNGKQCLRDAFIPFSSGARVCPGAGFAMVEGPLILALVARAFHVSTLAQHTPVPVAHLTVRAQNGIWISCTKRDASNAALV
ncbi:cytochrome P450 [Celeribacter marinus]|uniref:Cytochrome P450 family protein n=1 Tax=Celeribacter marinus TaxID=1397108 RepID=A0A0P0A023_9RHOB|nr:cytochrome P450 [Celeribacter marinus]ALI56009.1 cytochrome P450 family protein [Celeribacter marinus]SFK95722.1 Cytochrome P450 [Celeribacter marinus]